MATSMRLPPLGVHSPESEITYDEFVEVKEGFDEVRVHHFGVPLEEPLLDVEGREMADLLLLVAQRLEKPEEQHPVDLEVVLLLEFI